MPVILFARSFFEVNIRVIIQSSYKVTLCVMGTILLPQGGVLCGSHSCAPLRGRHSEEDRSWGRGSPEGGCLYLVCKSLSREHTTPALRGGCRSSPLFLWGAGTPTPLLALGRSRKGAPALSSPCSHGCKGGEGALRAPLLSESSCPQGGRLFTTESPPPCT